MIELLNHRLFLALAAAPTLSGWPLFTISALAEWLVYLVPAALVLLWIFGRSADREAAIAAVMTAVVAMFAAHVTSSLIFHPRPFTVEPVRNYLNHASDSSFPSDHATLFFAVGLSVAVHRPPSVTWLWLPMVMAGLAVGWARILLGAHYPLDVVGAAAIAGAAAFAMRSRPGFRAVAWLTAAAERLYGFVLPPRGRFIP